MSAITCRDCGAERGKGQYLFDLALRSADWEAIAQDGAYALCPCCISARASALGLQLDVYVRGGLPGITLLPRATALWRPPQVAAQEQAGNTSLDALFAKD